MSAILLERERSVRDVVRSIHDDLDLPSGYRAEIIGGELVVSASPFGIHAYIVERLRAADLNSALPKGFRVYENTTLEQPDLDRFIPDLAAWPVALVHDAVDQWIFPAAECVFAAEVTSPKQERRDYRKADSYARGGVPVYLLVDRKARKCVVFTEPSPDGYAIQRTVSFGTPVTLAFEGGGEAVVDTSDF